jgi:protein ImuB
MSRIVSVWLPRWPIQRALAAQARSPADNPIAPERPFVLAVTASGGARIAALNEAAEACGLTVGEPVADARAKAGFLQVRPVDMAADDTALRRLALWATRYTPTASLWGEENGADGFFLDIEGASHLFGGEQKLVADLATRLGKNFGLTARLAIAATPGAAWALSRFHRAPGFILPAGEEAKVMAPLPVESLRLSPDTAVALRRLGFKSVGALLDKPRAPFAARFAAELLRRLDQALGRIDEPLKPVVAPPVYHCLRYLIEPIFSQDAVVALASRLMGTLVHVLTRDGVGARALRLCLYGVDGAVKTVDIGLTLPTRSVSHVARLVELKLEAVAALDDAGFGFEAVGVAVSRAEPMPARQTEFVSAAVHPSAAGGEETGWGHDERTERCAALIDALRQRLGQACVRRFEAVASHIPERAETLAAVTGETLQSLPQRPRSAPEMATVEQIRPLLLLPHAEPAEEVAALVPEGPPRRFRWRGVTYEVTGAQGPERIGAEWWRMPASHRPAHSRESGDKQEAALTRDYYLVEDAGGHRFWLFREGLYGRETRAARWFVHGLLA